jgi:branched-chain amino acid aminotransferase
VAVMQIWINGGFVNEEQARLPLLSHAVGRGVIVFETLKICETVDGPALFTAQAHIDRLINSLDLLKMEPGYNKTEVLEAIKDCARINKVGEGVCKVFCYYPGLSWGSIPTDSKPSLAVICGPTETFGFNAAKRGKPVKMGISTFRKLHDDAVPTKAKVTGYYVGDYLSAIEAKERGIDVQIMVDMKGRLCEGGTFSSFFVKDQVACTPPVTRVLEGTTRQVVLDVAAWLGIKTCEMDIPADEVSGFDEAFNTASVSGLVPVSEFEGRALGNSCPRTGDRQTNGRHGSGVPG